jgi:hypothetical protein
MTDNGSEYVNQHMSAYLVEQGIKHQQTAPYSPQQNGQAERRNQTVMAMARCALIESGISEDKWPLAVKYAVYTLNRLPTKRIDWKTPYELWTGNKPDVQDLRPFGCKAFVHIDKSNRTSLQPTSYRGTFLGYSTNQKAWIIERESDGKIFRSHNVTCNENAFTPVAEAQEQVEQQMSRPELGPGEFLPDPDDVLDAQVLGWLDEQAITEATPVQNQEESVIRAYSTVEVDHPRPTPKQWSDPTPMNGRGLPQQR